ncbi:MAG: DUF4832 domain-containing protein [Hespellia sp.]|nr:DUF4832 domain-containing protein [Hespellia sp.]
MRMRTLSAFTLSRNPVHPIIWLSAMKTEEGKRKAGLKVEIFLVVCLVCLFFYFLYSRHVTIEKTVFTESNRELKNYDCGFYSIYGFMIQDEEVDFEKLVKEKYQNDTETRLTLIQINLQNYRNGEITQKGLANIEELFCALETIDKRLIVRFLYDWDGKALGQEPGNLATILVHMRQLKGILHKHQGEIFLIQGLFVGNWGEMNGTPYVNSTDMQRLASELEQVVDRSIYLAVRMPMQWRQITGLGEPSKDHLSVDSLAGRLGLFNDGMMGNESDYGTYGTEGANEVGIFAPWSRHEELEFQEKLCRWVPNGGEVIVENAYNDFESAKKDLALMHVTYLNRDYDQDVFDKWAKETVKDDGCFDGMDGLTYIQRHLGYRFMIADVDISHSLFSDCLSAEISLKNVGFAPIYREPELRLMICGEEECFTYKIDQSLRQLSGGTNREDILTLKVEIPLSGLSEKEYILYFSIVNPITGEHILLANEQEEEALGYVVGNIRLDGGRRMKE